MQDPRADIPEFTALRLSLLLAGRAQSFPSSASKTASRISSSMKSRSSRRPSRAARRILSRSWRATSVVFSAILAVKNYCIVAETETSGAAEEGRDGDSRRRWWGSKAAVAFLGGK